MKLAVEREMFTGYASKYERRRRQANVEIAQMCEEYAVHCAASKKGSRGGQQCKICAMDAEEGSSPSESDSDSDSESD